MVSPHAVLVGDRTAPFDYSLTRRCLQESPPAKILLCLFYKTIDYGCVDARAGSIDVRQMGHHVYPLASVSQSSLQRFLDLGDEDRQSLPLDRRFHRIDRVPCLPECVPQVWHAKSISLPPFAEQAAHAHSTILPYYIRSNPDI